MNQPISPPKIMLPPMYQPLAPAANCTVCDWNRGLVLTTT